MRVTSPSFDHEGDIPAEHSADGAGTLPPLEISDVPADAVSLAIISHDPDVPRDRRPDGNFDHWVVWNLAPGTTSIRHEHDHDGVVGVGTTSQHRWVPCAPPPGSGAHRYFFTVYALDTTLDLPADSNRAAVEAAMPGHVLDSARLMGRYERG